jgi:hypothetical protein
MTKFVSTPGSAYEVALDITAEEAAEQGLVIVEQSHSTNPPTPIFGRYKDAPAGSALGVTVAKEDGTKVVGAGGIAAPAAVAAADGLGQKGALLNINDPVVHGGTGDESVHADGAAPLADNDDAQREALLAGAHDSTQKASTDKKNAK